MKDKKEIKFSGNIIRCTYDSPDYKVYAVDVDRDKYPDVKFTKYGNATIFGNLYDLVVQQPYEITAVEEQNKYGYGYKVINIRMDKPRNEDDVYTFLQEILTFNQASELWKNYPDIIDRVVKGDVDSIDLNKLKGIKEYTFEKIKMKILQNYALYDLVIEFNGLLTISTLNKLYEKYSSVELLKQKLKEEPYKSLTVISGIGFIKADSILLELERSKKIDFGFDLKTSKQRCHSCITYLLDKNEDDGNTRIDIRDLRKQIIHQVPACAAHFVDCIKSEDFYFDKNNLCIAKKNTYETEKYIAEHIMIALENPNKWNINYDAYKYQGEFTLTNEQVDALKCICNNNIMILNGFAGSGKSATSSMIIKMLEDHNKSYVLFAPTGRAAKVLSEYTERQASTIHRGLGYMPPVWGYNEDNKLKTDVVIIDEFSMTDVFLFRRVIEAIDLKLTKIIMIGDSAQIPSVGAGRLLYDFIASNLIPTVTLNKIFRYGEGGLMTVATDVRNSKQYLYNITEKCTTFGEKKDYIFVQSNNVVEDTVYLYHKILKNYNPEDIQILSSYNKGVCGTVEINKRIQKIANKNIGSSNYIKCGDNIYYIDDIVIQNRNNYKAKKYISEDYVDDEDDKKSDVFIPNGMIGKITNILQGGVVIDFDGATIKYDKCEMQDISLAYSISIHKSQGGSAKIIILLTPPSHSYMLNSNLIYVGLTRTKQRCYHLGNFDTVNMSIKKKEDVRRNTWMQDLIKQCIDIKAKKEKQEKC